MIQWIALSIEIENIHTSQIKINKVLGTLK